MSVEGFKRQPLSEWFAQELRATFFPVTEFDPVELWESVFKEPADAQYAKPKEGIISLESSFEDTTFKLIYSPGKTDIKMEPSEKSPNLCSLIPVIGKYQDLSTKFNKKIHEILNLENFPDINRLAYAPSVIYPVSDRISGYKQLQPYLHGVQLDPDNSSDFIYRINRRRPNTLGIADLSINRLNKWMVIFYSIGKMQFSAEKKSHAILPLETKYACRIEMDINTIGEYNQELQKKQLVAIYDNLIAFADEIIIEGDVK